MTLTVITPPAGPAVPRDEVKAHLRIGHSGEDTLIDDLIAEATGWLETATELALIQRRLTRTVSDWSPRLLGRGWMLQPSPATSLDKIVLRDADGAIADTVTDRFSLVGGRLCLRPWSMLPAIGPGNVAEITFDAGYGSDEDVPPHLQLAVKETVAHFYQSGERKAPEAGQLPPAVEQIIASNRRVRL